MTRIASAPPAIIFVNDDINLQIQQWLSRQLNIDVVIDGYQFTEYISSDPDFPSRFKSLNMRLMVLIDFIEQHDRNHADIVAYVKNGLISIMKNNFGPPISSFQLLKIHWGQINVFNKQIGPGNINSKCKKCGETKKCILATYDPKRFENKCKC